jgi:hypothetical protein
MTAPELSGVTPARYFPPERGRYEVAPGLSRFGRDFGNGDADRCVFQFDQTFSAYRAAKLSARRERLDKYYRTDDLADDVAGAAAAFIARRLATEHARFFSLEPEAEGALLRCHLTREDLHLDARFHLTGATAPAGGPAYADALDALACQVQEDVAIVSTAGDRHWLSAVHLCFPNHWAAEAKAGRTFAAIHEPVAGMASMNARQDEFVRVMTGATDGLVRFAWGITTDDRLNHHPDPPPGVPLDAWRGRAFDPAHPRAFVRVERQTIWGLPDVGAALFTIRTSFVNCDTVRGDPAARRQLLAAIESMSPESLAYKGLATYRDALLDWLRSPSDRG